MCARLAAVSNEVLGMIDYFDIAVAHILPSCPVAAKVNNKRKNAQISGVSGYLKPGTSPKTGVELRYYKPHEFFKLTAEEVAELTRLRPDRKKVGDRGEKGRKKGNKRQGHGKKQPCKNKLEGQVIDLVKKRREEELENKKKETGVLAELSTLILAVSGKATVNDGAALAAVKLNPISKRRW